MTRLLLIRHGETDWNVEGRWQGQADVPLNSRGLEQASQVAQRLRMHEIQAIYASDLSRASQTAEALAKVTGRPVLVDTRLREIHQGTWQGMLVSQIQERYAEAFQQRRENPFSVAPPGGETAQQVQERVLHALECILADHPNDTVAVVSHGFVIAVILAYFENHAITKVWDLVPQNGQVLELEIDAGGHTRLPDE